jgi:asparagine synthase (glutamine-hydrolysing)
LPAPVRAAIRAGARALPRLSRARYRAEKLATPDALAPLCFANFPLDPALGEILAPRAHAALAPALETVAADLADVAALAPAQRLRAVDYRYFLEPDGLVKVDRASMQHSLEVRVPLLDSRVAALAAAWPADDLVAGGRGKQPLRRLARALLPAGVADLQKRGFSVPLQHVFTADDERAVLAAAHGSPLAREWLQLDRLPGLIAHWRGTPSRNLDTIVWRAVTFVLWARRWVES